MKKIKYPECVECNAPIPWGQKAMKQEDTQEYIHQKCFKNKTIPRLQAFGYKQRVQV